MNYKDKIKTWREEGRKFGYPQCCIDHFCRENQPINRALEDRLIIGGKLNTSNFIPCPKHVKEIVNGNTTLNELIDQSTRVEEKPFKEEWTSINKLYIYIDGKIIPYMDALNKL